MTAVIIPDPDPADDHTQASLLRPWAALIATPADAESTGRHRLRTAADPVSPNQGQDNEPVQWPADSAADSAVLGDYLRNGHLDHATRYLLAVVVEVFLCRGDVEPPKVLLAALENLHHQIVLSKPVLGHDVRAIGFYLRRGYLDQDVRDAAGSVLDVYVALPDVGALPTSLVVALEQLHQLVKVDVTATTAPLVSRGEHS